jgi:DNA-binding response OmpR family regulator
MAATLAIRAARADARMILVLPRSAESERLAALEAGVEEWIVTVRGVGYRLRPADVLTDH